MIYYGIQVMTGSRYASGTPHWAHRNGGNWYFDQKPVLEDDVFAARRCCKLAQKALGRFCRVVEFEAKFPKARRK